MTIRRVTEQVYFFTRTFFAKFGIVHVKNKQLCFRQVGYLHFSRFLGFFESFVFPSDIVFDHRMCDEQYLVRNGNESNLRRTLRRNSLIELLEDIVRLHILYCR